MAEKATVFAAASLPKNISPSTILASTKGVKKPEIVLNFE